jgi:hypothetical protein
MNEVLDPKKRQVLIDRGHERIKAFTWHKTAEKTLALYDRVAANPPRSSLIARDALRTLLR